MTDVGKMGPHRRSFIGSLASIVTLGAGRGEGLQAFTVCPDRGDAALVIYGREAAVARLRESLGPGCQELDGSKTERYIREFLAGERGQAIVWGIDGPVGWTNMVRLS